MAGMAGIAFLYLAGRHDWHSFPLLVQQCPQQLSHLDIHLYVGMHVSGIRDFGSGSADPVLPTRWPPPICWHDLA